MKIPFSFNPLGASKDSGGGMPTSGLVFYAKLETDLSDNEQRTLTSVGTVTTSSTADGLICTKLNNASYIYLQSSSGLPTGNADIAVSMWYKHDNSDYNNPQMFLHLGNDLITGHSIEMGVWQNNWHWNILLRPYEENFGTPDNSWHHMLIMRDTTSQKITMFIDGVSASEMTVPSNVFDLSYGNLIFGSRSLSTGNCTTKGCYIKAARIYNRVLTNAEIQLLASEFTPIE